MKKTVILFFVFLLVSAFNSESEVKTFGFYANEKSFDGEHSKGYTLHLWTYKNALIGWISYNEGLIGDQISGDISNVKYDQKRGTLSFESVLEGEKIKFSGKISKAEASGTFTWASKMDKKQTMESCCEDAPINRDYPTLKDWEKMRENFKE